MNLRSRISKGLGFFSITFTWAATILFINVILSQLFNLGLVTSSFILAVLSGIPLIIIQSISATIIISDYYERFKILLGHRSTEWQPVLPQVKEVLESMGYCKKIKFGFRPGINTVYTFRNSIVFDPALFFTLTVEQVQSIIAHEVHHMQNKYIKYTLGFTLLAEIGAVLAFFALPRLMLYIASLSMVHLLFVLLSWKMEYDADVSGAKYTSKETMISTLKFFIDYFGDAASFSHPSASDRIKNLKTN